MKRCTVCNVNKTLESYYKLRGSRDGHSYRCKDCDNSARQKWTERNPERARLSARSRYLKCTYGLTLKEYNNILKSQGYRCGICRSNTNEREGFNGTSFSVDHCHDSGKVRGLLCNQCNRGLGMLGDTVGDLKKALKYLEKTH